MTLVSEAALLFVAAQAGFIDGPRVMSNMAIDSWLPHRFAALSERLTTHNGILLMGGGLDGHAASTPAVTRRTLVRDVLHQRLPHLLALRDRHGPLLVPEAAQRRDSEAAHRASTWSASLLCVSILTVSVLEKFSEGGWITLVVTAALVALCFAIRSHYDGVTGKLKRLDAIMAGLPEGRHDEAMARLDPRADTAVLLVGGYGGLGIHQLLTVQRIFRGHYENVLFISVGVIDAVSMKGLAEAEALRHQTEETLKRYVELAHRLGLRADWRCAIGTEAVGEAEKLCREIAQEFPHAIFFAGKLVFEREQWFQRLLHNETAYQIQRRLQFAGLNAMVLPVRVMDDPQPVATV